METIIGQKIKELRERKGLSQTELANQSGISLRTVQRIENNQTSPHGKTLQLLCESLGTGVEEILDYGTRDDHQYLMFFHLSVLAGIFIPLGNVILPLVLWLTKKDDIKHLKNIGARLLNFQIVFQAITSVALITIVFSKIMNSWFSGMPLLAIYFMISSLNYVAAVTLAIFNYKGRIVTYPSIIRMIK
ncbi:MAG: helix-turn-helix domain-containing protein [Nonlabens sp.]